MLHKLIIKKLITEQSPEFLSKVIAYKTDNTLYNNVLKLINRHFIDTGNVISKDMLLATLDSKVPVNKKPIYIGYVEGLDSIDSNKVTNEELLVELKDTEYIEKLDSKIVDLVNALQEKEVDKVKNIILDTSNEIITNQYDIVRLDEEEYTPASLKRIPSFIEGDSDLAGVTIIGGQSGGGKSVLLLNFLLNAHKVCNEGVLLMNLELGRSENTARIISHLFDIDVNEVLHASLNQSNKYTKMLRDYFKGKADFLTVNTPINEETVLSMIRQYNKTHGIQIFGIDYISIVESSNNEDDWKSISRLVKKLHRLCLELGIVILTPVQIDIDKNSEDVRVRSSRELLNSASRFITILQSAEEKELNVARLKDIKNRQGELKTHILETDFKRMSFKNSGVFI